MAIKDFTDTLATQSYRSWFRALTPNVIKEGSSALREKYEKDPTKNNFLLTDEKIRDMAAFVTDGTQISDQDVANVKAKMFETLKNVKNAGVVPTIKDYGPRDPKLGQEIVFENVNFQTIEALLLAGFSKQVFDSGRWKRSVGSGFHRGHVYGLPTVLLNETIAQIDSLEIKDEEVDKIKGRGAALKNTLLDILKAYKTELRTQDQLSSNMGAASVNYDIYAEYSKNSEQFLIEMQVRRVNTVSGTQAGKTLAELKQFLNYEKMNAGILGKIKDTLTKPSVILDFLKTPTSPPWIELATNKLLNAIDPKNKTRVVKTYSISPVKVATTKIAIKRSTQDKNRVNKEIEKVSKLITELSRAESKAKTIKLVKSTPNLTNLQNLINASLVERVKANMGTGNRRDVLNLRTGRFAESVKVERMSQSREGMITAFYSYMKNPYATFSQGGAQASPKSRDPKLLIAKSIREIAAQQVANRLRSVAV